MVINLNAALNIVITVLNENNVVSKKLLETKIKAVINEIFLYLSLILKF